jgi:lipase chaperone LimK
MAEVPAALAGRSRPERSAAAVEQALYAHGSLQGSDPDGGFALDAAGQLLPSLGLRRRFDHLLTAMAEASLNELGSLLRAQAARALAPAQVDRVMALWADYLTLQQYPFQHDAALGDAGSWQAALDERVRIRRQVLGPAWADAFYSAEEAATRAHIASMAGDTAASAGSTRLPLALPAAARAPRPGDDLAALQQRRVAELGPEAAQRLQQLDLAQADWGRRLTSARQALAEIAQAPELSEPQRQAQVQQYLTHQFSDAERTRARAVLGLPPAR